MSRLPSYPIRPRRLRDNPILREVLADVVIRPECLIQPVFVTRRSEAVAIGSMPGVKQWPVDQAAEQIAAWRAMGIRQFLLFGVVEPSEKDELGSSADDDRTPVVQLIRKVREMGIDALLWADVCLCEYTSHGHCGILKDGAAPGRVDNDATLPRLASIACKMAEAGADVVAPSSMMDGQVGAIRDALAEGGWDQTVLCSYAVKYASALYGPFREAGEGGMKEGDRRGYQMDHRRSREWTTEVDLDLAEGADMLIVKPAHTYLDILRGVRESTDCPLIGYHVSGEYAMLMSAAEMGRIDLRQAGLEITASILRAGADMVISYLSPQLAEWLH